MSHIATGKNFSAGTLPSWNPDVVVIGSGMSGLSSAAILSSRGKKVMVLEQHDTAGGSCHHFKQGSEWVSAGWHYVGRPSGPNKILWDYMTNNQKFTNNTKDVVDTYHGVGHFTGDNISEVMGFKLEHLKRVQGHLMWVIMVKLLPAPLARLAWWLYKLTGKHGEAQMNWGTWCKKMTGAKEEKDIWWTQRGDHGMSREKTTAMLSALVMYHYRNGAIHPEGGVRDTMLRIVKRIQDNGGCVLLKANVTRICISNNKVTGVEVASDGGGDPVSIKCRDVVVTGAEATAKLTGDKCPKEIAKAVAQCGPSVCHGTIFLTFTGKTPKELELPMGNVWCQEQFFISSKESATGTVVYILWEMDYIKRGADYEEKKEEASQKAFQFALSLYPRLKEHDEFDHSTPATTEFYLSAPAGNSYGLALPPERFGNYSMVRALRPQTSVKGLWMTGQDILSPGVMAALAAGFLTTQSMCYPGLWGFTGNVIKDVWKVSQKNKKN